MATPGLLPNAAPSASDWVLPNSEVVSRIGERDASPPVAVGCESALLLMDAAPAVLRTILFAEDNEDVRELTTCFLGMMGFRVVACRDADVASTAFRSDFGIDMLMTDLEMPGRSGIELARELTALRPSLPVVIVSGSIPSEHMLNEIKDQTGPISANGVSWLPW